MINKLSIISRGGLKFIVMDAPNNENAEQYASQLQFHNVSHLVRTCEGKYDDEIFKSRGIMIHDLFFSDGSAPQKEKLHEFLEVVKMTFFEAGKIKKASGTSPCIAVHCLSGLGRAPVLIAIALIEAGLDPSHAIDLIRRNRQGALNQNQIKFLMRYKRLGVFNRSCCAIF
ncbi:hypothetical protein SteCoe_25953 [Stentor coeruleus]|uniref:Tyrosine specific protein phosphatases domain-containing protein n=1 Tax=Stentor coeruleus TaxID=5963 RepID=A0A1R2BEC9_9CILI|nr:hypothetical protein SteCoe_25953 [Stentor coeruleus]